MSAKLNSQGWIGIELCMNEIVGTGLEKSLMSSR